MSLEDIPSYFATATGINETSAQVILSVTVIFTFLLPVMILSRGKNATTLYLIMTILAECLLVGIGWMPFWILIATLAVITLSMSSALTELVTGD